MERLKRRAAFKAVAGGRRVSRPGFLLQALANEERAIGDKAPRFGFTVTKKLGNAVVRNRIRRRLKAAVAQAEDKAETATDYVVVGRRAALTLPFERLVTDLMTGFQMLSSGKAPATGSGDAR